MANEGWIKLHRQFLNWEWHDSPATAYMFVVLLLLANHEGKNWHGVTIQRGQVVMSIRSLAKTSGLTEREVRTALSHLEETGEIEKVATHSNTLVTICNYDRYQVREEVERHSSDTQNDTQNDKETTQFQTDLFGEESSDYNDIEKPSDTKTTHKTTHKTTTNKKIKNKYIIETQSNIETSSHSGDWRFLSSVERYSLGSDPDRIAGRKKIYFRSEVEGLAQIVGMPSEQVEKFVRYWTEHSKGNERIKADLEPTFDMESRMRGWMERENSKPNAAAKPKSKMETLIDTHNELQEWIHDTYGNKSTGDRTPDYQSGE